MHSGHVEPYVQLRINQAEAQRAYQNSDVASNERRARFEFDEAERIYRIKKQALIFAQINVKNSKLFQNLQAVNTQCDRQANSYPDANLPNNFTQNINSSLVPPHEDVEVDSQDLNGIFTSTERKSLGAISHSIAPSYGPLPPNLSSGPINLSSSPVTRPSVPTTPLPSMESCSHIVSLLGRWPGIQKTYTMRWQPNRVGACPRHVLRKEKCPGSTCELWKNIERDIRLNPIPISVVTEMNNMEMQLTAMKDAKRVRRASSTRPGMKTDNEHDTPNRKKARTESSQSNMDGSGHLGSHRGLDLSMNDMPNLSDSPLMSTSLSTPKR